MSDIKAIDDYIDHHGGLEVFIENHGAGLQSRLRNLEELGTALNITAQNIRSYMSSDLSDLSRSGKFLKLIKDEKSTSSEFIEALEKTENWAALEYIKTELGIVEKEMESRSNSNGEAIEDFSNWTPEGIAIMEYVRRNTLEKLLKKAGPDFCSRFHDNQVELLVMWMNSLSERTMVTNYQQQCIRSKGTAYDKASYLMEILRTKSASSERLRNSGFSFQAETTRVLLDALSKAELHHITPTLYEVCVKDN